MIKWKYGLYATHTVPQSIGHKIIFVSINTFSMVFMMTINTLNEYTIRLHFSQTDIAKVVIIIHHISNELW